jgi:ABC-2 type transport system ATP-binding protein
MASAISTRNLTKHYNGIPAVDGVTLDVPPGSIGLLGENGAGKTTFIKLLLGLLRPTAGAARVLDVDVAERPLEARRLLGYMPEDDCLPQDFSAFDLVVRLGRLSGLPREAAVQRTNDVLHLVGLGEERYRPIGGYSTGMKQRVKLAQALVHDPKLVLLDEPTSGLDPQGREEMLQLIRDIHRKMGISLLVSTHLLPDVERVCDHIVIFRAGQVLAQGPLEELLRGVSEGLLVRVIGDRGAFLRGLQVEGLSARPLDGEILVQAEGDAAYDAILKRAAETGVQLRRLERQDRSLEDLFLELYAEGGR